MTKYFIISVSTLEEKGVIYDHDYIINSEIMRNMFGFHHKNRGWRNISVDDILIFYTTKKTIKLNSQSFVAISKLKTEPYRDLSGESKNIFIGDDMFRADLYDLKIPSSPVNYKNIVGLSWKPLPGTACEIDISDYEKINNALFD